MSPADVKAILQLHDDGVGSLEISAQLCIPVVEVRKVIANQGSAAAKDMRVEAIVRDALASHRQRTRNLGERLKAALDECMTQVMAERVERAEKERKAREKQQLAQRINELQAALSEARKALRGNGKTSDVPQQRAEPGRGQS